MTIPTDYIRPADRIPAPPRDWRVTATFWLAICVLFVVSSREIGDREQERVGPLVEAHLSYQECQ